MASSILIVEDSVEVQVLLRKTLNGLSGELQVVPTVKDARQALRDGNFQLILLDISLPDEDGLQFFSELRSDEKTRSIPVMFLTGKREVTHKVAAFSMGAEDYIEKPFNALELRARVEAKLKKNAAQRDEQQVLTRGHLKLDASSQRAFSIDDLGKSTQIRLTPKEFKLLFHMARSEDRVFSRDQLLSAVWGDASEVFDRNVDTHISSIRKKLGSLSFYIESVPGQGYRFTSAARQAA